MNKASDYPREDHDWYIEGEDCVEGLFAAEHFAGISLDPACGIGTIPLAGLKTGHGMFGSDLVERRKVSMSGSWNLGAHDFLDDAYTGMPFSFGRDRPDNIIFNPPYGRGKLAEAFIRKALGMARHKVAAFVTTRFLGSEGRASGLFDEYPPSRIWMIAPRPSCAPGGPLMRGEIKAEGGSMDYVWVVWRVGERPSTQFGWINRHTKEVFGR